MFKRGRCIPAIGALLFCSCAATEVSDGLASAQGGSPFPDQFDRKRVHCTLPPQQAVPVGKALVTGCDNSGMWSTFRTAGDTECSIEQRGLLYDLWSDFLFSVRGPQQYAQRFDGGYFTMVRGRDRAGGTWVNIWIVCTTSASDSEVGCEGLSFVVQSKDPDDSKTIEERCRSGQFSILHQLAAAQQGHIPRKALSDMGKAIRGMLFEGINGVFASRVTGCLKSMFPQVENDIRIN